MKKYTIWTFGLFIFICVNLAAGQEDGFSVDWPSTQDSQDPSVFYANIDLYNIKYVELNRVCKEFKGQHLADINRLEKLFVLAKSKVLSGDSIEDTALEIKQIATRIRYNSKPEWNRPVIALVISWNIPAQYFFIAPDFAKDIIEKNNTLNSKPLSYGDILSAQTRYMGLIDSNYLNFKQLQCYADNSFEKFCFASGEKNNNYSIGMINSYTFFETCQLLESIEFDLTIAVNDFLVGDPQKNVRNLKLRIKKGIGNDLE